jgi:hypothetical protein
MKRRRLAVPVNWKLEKVISGGQIGADIAGLRAAQRAGIPTGGYMPLGFVTLFGLRPEYASEYGMQECPINGYRHRTFENVRHSDGTLRIAYRFNSAGEICTMQAIRQIDKPWLDVSPSCPVKPRAVASWLQYYGIRVLNVAGNADIHLEPFVETYLAEVFKWLKSE